MPNNTRNESYLSRVARKKAEELGLTGDGHNDALDAFRHAYISAVFSYATGNETAHFFGELNEIKGDIFNDQPPTERYMDEFNNSIGRKIGSKTTDKNDLAKNVYSALVRGELIIDQNDKEPKSPVLLDNFYIPPIGIPDPAADNPGFFGSISNGLSDAASGIGDFFSSIGSGISGAFLDMAGRFGGGSASSLVDSSSGDSQIDTSALIRALGGRTGFGRSKTGQVVLPTGAMIAQALIKSRRKSLENDLIEIFTGGKTSPMEKHKGTPPLIPDGSERGVSDLMFDAIERGVGAALSRQRTRTSTGETERSREARSSWNLSRSQQAAALSHWMGGGARNA